MKRKEFIKKSIGAALVAVPAYAMLSCSKDDTANGDVNLDPDQADCLANGADAKAISSNHGHTLIVSKEDIDAGADKAYSIKGSSGHDHEIIITAANFTSLKSKQSIVVESTTGASHRHDVTISCA